MKNEHDDLIVVLTFRMNRREPHGVSWTTEKPINDEDAELLFCRVKAALEASIAVSQVPPTRIM